MPTRRTSRETMGGSHPSVEAGGSKTTENNSAAAYAVRSTLSDAELAQARTAFFETDRDGSGAIERSELALMLKSLGQTPTKRMIQEIFPGSYANPGSPVKELKLKDFEALLLGS